MMRNKNFRYLAMIVAVFSLLGVGTYLYLDQKTSYSVLDADYKNYSSLQELINDSDLIITGQPLSSLNHVTRTREGYTDEAYTITDFQIDSIKQMSSSIKVISSQTIKVVEPTYVYHKGIEPGKIKFSIDGYQQMKEDSKYILFLRINETGDKFLINGVIQGKYNIDSTDNLEINDMEDAEKFNRFKNDLKSLYKIN